MRVSDEIQRELRAPNILRTNEANGEPNGASQRTADLRSFSAALHTPPTKRPGYLVVGVAILQLSNGLCVDDAP